MTEFRPQKLLFGLSLGTSKKIKDQVETEVLRGYPEIQTVCRYRKEGIYQYLKEQENILVIMEENLQGGSGYTVGELQQLTDLGNSRVIFLMDRVHSGDDYVRALYSCGICDALYLDEATPKEVLHLVFHARNNEAARKYYGIQVLRDAEKAGGVVNEGKLEAYLEYLEEQTEEGEQGDKYRFVSTRLSEEENRILAAGISGKAAQALKGNEVFEFYRGGDRKRGLFLKRRKKDVAADSMPVQQASLAKEPARHLHTGADHGASEKEEDEMFCALERFWEVGGKETNGSEGDSGAGLLVMFAGYLDTVDT